MGLRASWKRAATLGIGSVALGTAMLYIAGAAAVFLGLSPTWTKLFLTHFLWMLYVPMCLLLVHVWARVQVGRWLLEEGDLQGAMEWTTGRVRPNFWLRGKREALGHRLNQVQVHVRLVDYDSAAALLWEQGVRWPGGGAR